MNKDLRIVDRIELAKWANRSNRRGRETKDVRRLRSRGVSGRARFESPGSTMDFLNRVERLVRAMRKRFAAHEDFGRIDLTGDATTCVAPGSRKRLDQIIVVACAINVDWFIFRPERAALSRVRALSRRNSARIVEQIPPRVAFIMLTELLTVTVRSRWRLKFRSRVAMRKSTQFEVGGVAGLIDGQLLERFTARGGVGQKKLSRPWSNATGRWSFVSAVDPGDEHAAQDAFQVMSLVPANSGSLWSATRVGPWLRASPGALLFTCEPLRIDKGGEQMSAELANKRRTAANSYNQVGPVLDEEIDRLRSLPDVSYSLTWKGNSYE